MKLLLHWLLGRPLANREHQEQKIGWLAGVPAMGLDGLGSSSYGPEAALAILMPLGAVSLAWIGWVIAPIVALLAIVYLSYRAPNRRPTSARSRRCSTATSAPRCGPPA